MYVINMQQQTHMKGKVILGIIGIMLGLSLGFYFSVRTLPAPEPTQYIYLESR